ncbi:MAG: DNA topoisomerase IV subunit A [Bacilli bacterium]
MQNDINKRVHIYALEEIMGDRFGRYAKTIIQDRAIPDVRDGLKPVQRRILYGMYHEKNTFDKPYRKSAKTVGHIMGNFHPHGDSSIYDAMVRMSQWWKQNTMYVDMQGNNGSMDGDSAAAMRYTEARLSKISNELLKDIYKDTVVWAPNFDDTEMEPTVLPAKYPNLLVNGSSGISAGYATNIPTHNLGEIIDATIKRIESPNCRLETILDIVKGPDFPTGGTACGKQGIIDAFTTGRGKVIVKCKSTFEKEKGKESIIITEIPFEVNKANMVKKIDDIRIDKKIEGIAEVRDESDREGLRIAIDLKKDANRELVLNYLLKNTEMQISYNYNMVAIVNRRPMTLGILPILDAYIAHQKEVITRRTQFDLKTFKHELHISEGLIKAMSILDEVIKVIRGSNNKTDARNNLVTQFQFTEIQAEAIITLQLYRLTNTDVVALQEKVRDLQLIIANLEAILNDEERLLGVMKEELRKVKKEYAEPRKTIIEDEITEIKIETIKMIPKEDCYAVITNEGYVKRVSTRSYNKDEETTLKDGDFVTGLYKVSTIDTLLIFTNLGNYLFVPVYELPEIKWKELGKHISNIVKIDENEVIIGTIPVTNFDSTDKITLFTKNGMIKRTNLKDYKVTRYSKPIMTFKLKENDEVVNVTNNQGTDIFITTSNGFGLRYKTSEVTEVGLRAAGVKAVSLKNDTVVCGQTFSDADYLTVITDKGTGKRIKIDEFESGTRARKGIQMVRDVKTNPYHIIKTFINLGRVNIVLKLGIDMLNIKSTELPIADRYSTGTQITKEKIDLVYEASIVEDIKEETLIDETKVDLNKVDEKIMTIDDFLDDFEIKN